MPVQFRNLVFEGGGVKGIAYVGAMRALRRHGALEHIIRYGGTSAGAINALIVALGYSEDEQLEVMRSADFRRFMDDDFGALRDGWRLMKEFGWNRGDYFSDWIGGLIAGRLGRPDATFGDLAETGRSLFVVGANLGTGFAEVFSVERHPTMSLARAVRISMSIPLMFAAVRHGEYGDVYVDGGVTLNYPVKLFDRQKYIAESERAYAARETSYYHGNNVELAKIRTGSSPYVYNRQTLGLRLDTREQIGLYRYGESPKRKAVGHIGSYAMALFNAMRAVQENQHLHSDDWHRSVYIDTLDVGTTDFDITNERKEALVAQGVAGVEAYFKWFVNAGDEPCNRIPTAPPPGPRPLGVPVMDVRL